MKTKMKKYLSSLTLVAVLVTACQHLQGQEATPPNQPDPAMVKRAEELKNLRWGMFICWSFSTFSGKEWTSGVQDVAFFKATECDTDQWVKTAKEAGMGYVLFLAKHHDGFCLWDTKTTDRKVTKAPLGRDVLAELRKSCDKYGIKLAIYFSEGDWTWPGAHDGKGGGSGKDAEKERAQLTELLTQYGPIEYMWVDVAGGLGGLSHQEFLAHCKSLQPGCLIGFNQADQTGVLIRVGERGKPGPLNDPTAAPHLKKTLGKDYLLAEFTYPILPRQHKGGADWFYSLPEHDGLCLPAQKLYDDYLGAVKYGNIFSIDVGPDYNGKLREIDVKTLREVGQMIREGKQ
jgi:alpha-L-fucosidase